MAKKDQPEPKPETPAEICERLGHDWEADTSRGEGYARCKRCGWAP